MSNTTIESASLSANVPITSHRDFSLGFNIASDRLTPENKAAVASKLEKAFPQLNISTWGDNTIISCRVEDTDTPGICKYLVRMFQAAKVPLSGQGGSRYQEPPHLESSPSPEGLPDSMGNFETFLSKIDELVSP